MFSFAKNARATNKISLNGDVVNELSFFSEAPPSFFSEAPPSFFRHTDYFKDSDHLTDKLIKVSGLPVLWNFREESSMAPILQSKNESWFFCCDKARKVYSMNGFMLQRREVLFLFQHCYHQLWCDSTDNYNRMHITRWQVLVCLLSHVLSVYFHWLVVKFLYDYTVGRSSYPKMIIMTEVLKLRLFCESYASFYEYIKAHNLFLFLDDTY